MPQMSMKKGLLYYYSRKTDFIHGPAVIAVAVATAAATATDLSSPPLPIGRRTRRACSDFRRRRKHTASDGRDGDGERERVESSALCTGGLARTKGRENHSAMPNGAPNRDDEEEEGAASQML